jgi:hypothetical protein
MKFVLPMKASELIEELKGLVEKHGGDIEVSAMFRGREYSVDSAGYEPAGPIAKLRGIQDQNPPERIVLDAEEEIEDDN